MQEQSKVKSFQDDIKWRHRSRDKWIKEGDDNTKFFHAIASIHRRVNNIRSISIDGSTMTDKDDIISSILNYFKDLYFANPWERLPITSLPFRSISGSKALYLEYFVSEDEIRAVVWDLSDDRA